MLTITQLLPDLAATGAAPRAAAMIPGTRLRTADARELGGRGMGMAKGEMNGTVAVTASAYQGSATSTAAGHKTAKAVTCTWNEIRFDVPAFHNRWPLCPT